MGQSAGISPIVSKPFSAFLIPLIKVLMQIFKNPYTVVYPSMHVEHIGFVYIRVHPAVSAPSSAFPWQ